MQEELQEEELQEEDQQVIETWTRNVKACTCDCESAESPTLSPAVIPAVPPTSLPTPPPQGHPLTCMPGEDSTWTPCMFHLKDSHEGNARYMKDNARECHTRED